jgi:hypothetical protein
MQHYSIAFYLFFIFLAIFPLISAIWRVWQGHFMKDFWLLWFFTQGFLTLASLIFNPGCYPSHSRGCGSFFKYDSSL